VAITKYRITQTKPSAATYYTSNATASYTATGLTGRSTYAFSVAATSDNVTYGTESVVSDDIYMAVAPSLSGQFLTFHSYSYCYGNPPAWQAEVRTYIDGGGAPLLYARVYFSYKNATVDMGYNQFSDPPWAAVQTEDYGISSGSYAIITVANVAGSVSSGPLYGSYT
jgi:hypothetical protein